MKQAVVCIMVLLAGVLYVTAQNDPALMNQQSQSSKNNTRVFKQALGGNGYRVALTNDTVFIQDKDLRLVYACPVTDTSYLAVIKTLRTTGKFQPSR
ncbi:MAG: hypothetical protein U0T75_16020 [Chitinophagales bacterium]